MNNNTERLKFEPRWRNDLYIDGTGWVGDPVGLSVDLKIKKPFVETNGFRGHTTTTYYTTPKED